MSGSTSVACWVLALVNGSVLTRVSVTGCPAAGLANSRLETASRAAPKLEAGKDSPFTRRIYYRLSARVGNLDRVLAGEAGEAEAVAVRAAHRAAQAGQRQVVQRVRADDLADTLLGVVGGDQLAPGRHVDAHEAGPHDRRRGDPQVNLVGAGPAQFLDDAARGRAPHDRVVDQHHPLAGQDVPHRVELE